MDLQAGEMVSAVPSEAWVSAGRLEEGRGRGQGAISELGGRQFVIVSNFFRNKQRCLFQSHVLQVDTGLVSPVPPSPLSV